MYLKKALRGTLIVFMISLLGGLFGYLTRIVLARNLSVAEFGLFYSVVTIFLFITYFVDAGLGQAVARKIIELTIKKRTPLINDLIMNIMSFQLSVSLIIGVLLVVFSKYLSQYYFHANASSLIIIFAIWLVSMPILSSFVYTIYGYQRSEIFAFIDMLKYFLIMLFSIVGILLGFGFAAPAYAYLIAQFVLIIIAYLFAKRLRKISFKFKVNKALTVETIKFGMFILFTNLAWFLITQLDTMAVTYFTNPVQVAIYQIAVPISGLILYITSSISLVVYPLATELYSKKGYKQLIAGLELIYTYLIIVILPITIMMYAFPDIIINILFTSKYTAAAPVLRILSISAIFFSICMINTAVLTAIGKPHKIARIMIGIAVLNLLLNIMLVPRYGIIGAAYATLASFIVGTIISIIYARKEIAFSFPYYAWGMLTLISIGMIFFINWLRGIILLTIIPKLIVIAAITAIVYAALLLVLRIIKFQDILFFTKLILKKDQEKVN
ncbi:MAG: flippase [Candidatus Woesearchaeota archaeon]